MKFSNHGLSMKPVYQSQVVNGMLEVVQVDETSLYDEIQSHSESTDIATIVAKAVYDPSILNAREGTYGDFTKMPKTYAGMLQKMIDAEVLFNKLTPEARAAYGNDVFKFISSMDEKDWLEKSGLAVKKEESEVTPDESER